MLNEYLLTDIKACKRDLLNLIKSQRQEESMILFWCSVHKSSRVSHTENYNFSMPYYSFPQTRESVRKSNILLIYSSYRLRFWVKKTFRIKQYLSSLAFYLRGNITRIWTRLSVEFLTWIFQEDSTLPGKLEDISLKILSYFMMAWINENHCQSKCSD